MPTRPPAPDSLPQYLSEGVPKQDDEDLRALQGWIDALLTYRQDVAAEDIDADEGESIEAVEESSAGSLRYPATSPLTVRFLHCLSSV
jgi:hypothetical protein